MRTLTRSVFQLEELYVRVGEVMSRGFPPMTPRARRLLVEQQRRAKAEAYAQLGLPDPECELGMSRMPLVYAAWDDVPAEAPGDLDAVGRVRWRSARKRWTDELLRWARDADPDEFMPVWVPPM